MRHFRILRLLTVIAFVAMLGFYAAYSIYYARTYDSTPPVIRFDEDTLRVSVTDGDAALLTDVTAEDKQDGDVSTSLVIASKARFSAENTRKITYAAFDHQGNIATAERTVIYTDYASPEFTLSQPLRYCTGTTSYDYMDNLSVVDCLDGDIAYKIKYSYDEDNYVYYNGIGEMRMTFSVSNSAGDTSSLDIMLEILTVDEYAKPCPALSEYVVYTDPGETLDLSGYIIGYMQDGVTHTFADSSYSAGQVSISGDVDYSTSGTYRVIYTLNRSYGSEQLGSVSLYVVVR